MPLPALRPPAAPALLARLKTDTVDLHTRLEATVDLLAVARSRERYCWLLGRLHGLYTPIEERCDALGVWPALGLDAAARRRRPALERDLRVLGLLSADIARLPRCATLPPLADLPSALGCLYVLEGSTLGGQLIARHLRATLGLTAASGAAFFTGAGPATGAAWQQFRLALTATAAPLAADDAIIAGARATFATFAGWLREEGPA